MQDGTSSSSALMGNSNNNNNASRMTKRRRLDDSDEAAATSEPFDQHWNEDAHTQQQAFVSGQVPSDFPAANALGSTEGSSWPPSTNTTSDVSAYPDLSSYQQQPYFYGQTPSWNSTAAPSFGDTTAATASASYSVGEQTTATTMPFFPPSNSSNVGDDSTAAFNYPDIEVANQYASYTAPSATAQLAQREAAKSSAYYFDDASMHLKIQSLPILDNLVSSDTATD